MKQAIIDFLIGMLGCGLIAYVVTLTILAYQGNDTALIISATFLAAMVSACIAVYVANWRWQKEQKEITHLNAAILYGELIDCIVFSENVIELFKMPDATAVDVKFRTLMMVDPPNLTVWENPDFLKGLPPEIMQDLRLLRANYFPLRNALQQITRSIRPVAHDPTGRIYKIPRNCLNKFEELRVKIVTRYPHVVHIPDT